MSLHSVVANDKLMKDKRSSYSGLKLYGFGKDKARYKIQHINCNKLHQKKLFTSGRVILNDYTTLEEGTDLLRKAKFESFISHIYGWSWTPHFNAFTFWCGFHIITDLKTQ